MKDTIHSLNDKYIIQNCIGSETQFSAELLAWNSIIMIMLTIASFAVMVNRLNDNNKHNALIKFCFGGLGVVSLAGLFYPIEFGLIGINLMATTILVLDFFKYKKHR